MTFAHSLSTPPLFHVWQLTCRRAQEDPWCSKCLPHPPQSSALPGAGWPSLPGRLRSATNRQGHLPAVGTVPGKQNYETTTEHVQSTRHIQTLAVPHNTTSLDGLTDFEKLAAAGEQLGPLGGFCRQMGTMGFSVQQPPMSWD